MLLSNGDPGISGEKVTSLGYRPPAPVARRPILRDYFHSNPLANIAAITTDNDIFFNKDIGTSYSFQIQPVYSFDFPKQGFSFIPRGVIPILGVPPLADLPRLGLPRPKGDGTTWGLGDIVTQFFFAPKSKGGWKFGLGPQLSWKTRTDNRVGGPGWGAGPVGVLVGGIGENISIATIVGNLWSFDGEFNSLLFQPMIFYNINAIPGAYIGYNAAISADWKANSSNTWILPLGAVVGKTFDLGGGYGLDLSVGTFGYPVKPEGGPDWSLKFGITLLFPR
jgi:hypothetical protein